MTAIRVARTFSHPPAKVWRALTEPELMARWGMRPEGFAPVVGTRFRLIGKRNPMWRGLIECEVLEARAPEHLRYTWINNAGDLPTIIAYTLEPRDRDRATRVVIEHTGLIGLAGFAFAHIFMRPGLARMLRTRLPPLLATLA